MTETTGWPEPDGKLTATLSGVASASSPRRMFRYIVPVDDQPHTITLTGDPVAVAVPVVMEFGAGGRAMLRPTVEFWAEHAEAAGQSDRTFQVFGTGHPLPDGARWIGTCARVNGLVWHLYEVTT